MALRPDKERAELLKQLMSGKWLRCKYGWQSSIMTSINERTRQTRQRLISLNKLKGGTN